MNYNKIIEIISQFEYQELSHIETISCENSAKVRKEAWLIWIWSKNLLFHCKWKFYLVTTIWTKDIEARNFKKEFWSKDIRFATKEELFDLLEANIWSVPPFWFSSSNLPIYIDQEIFEHEYFIFNPSVPTRSIQIKTSDLKQIYDSLPNPIKYFKWKNDEFEILP